MIEVSWTGDYKVYLAERQDKFWALATKKRLTNALDDVRLGVAKLCAHSLSQNPTESLAKLIDLVKSCTGCESTIRTLLSSSEKLKGICYEELKVIHLKNASKPQDQRLFEELLESNELNNLPINQIIPKPKLLLHVCCGPDAGGALEQLVQDYDVYPYWYDPNIQPKEEHDLRLDAFKKVCEIYQLPYGVGPYEVDEFFDAIKGLENTPEKGAKCSVCYDIRLDKSAHEAKKLGMQAFATTLAISPHKVQEKLKSFGYLAAKKHEVPYLHRDFKKAEGFNDSVSFSETHHIYRQDYCGCIYSLKDGGPRAQKTAAELGLIY